jgi:drug/metabolite transporter (DMT)-like permease
VNALALVLALASATCFGLSSAMEQRAAKQERPRMALDPRLLFRLLRRPLWLSGWVPDVAGTGLQALALRFGPLALVQSVLVSGLFLAILLEAALNRSRPQARDLTAVALGVVGLAAFLTAAQPSAGVSDPSPLAWAGVALGAGSVVTVCLAFAARSSAAARGTLLGLAAGMLYSVMAALYKPLATAIAADPLAAPKTWHLYAVIIVGFAALQLNQNAFQSGPLAAPLTALSLTDPVASVVIAVTAFHETLDVKGARLVIEVVSVATMSAGIWLASRGRRRNG